MIEVSNRIRSLSLRKHNMNNTSITNNNTTNKILSRSL